VALPAGWLEALPVAELVRLGTPFFWLNVVRSHAACGDGGRDLALALRHLLMTGFDAYFSVLADGFSCRLPADDAGIVLPRLGVHLPACAGPARLCRAGQRLAQVEAEGAQAMSVPLNDVPAGARLRWLPVGHDGTARLLLHAHPALLPPSCAADIPTDPADPAGHAAMITAALELIQEVDPRLGAEIAAAIRWYVLLTSPDPDVHRSRTVLNLRGVLFLSPGRDRLMLAEAIVHEHYHGTLNARIELEQLLVDDDRRRFYSPWRNDLRPLAGLLHAVYVFTGVAEFLLRAERTPSLAEQRGAIRERRRVVVERLRLGHAQVPWESFTPHGRRLLEGLKAVIDSHETDLGLPRDRLPDALLAHLRQWCVANPDLAAGVRPFRSGA
jgi:HEXXH motif-containing protein